MQFDPPCLNPMTPTGLASAASFGLDKQSIMSALSDEIQVFFHDFTSIPEFDRFETWLCAARFYDERALLLAREKDVVLTRFPVDTEYLNFLKNCGIGPDGQRVVTQPDHIPELIGSSRSVLNSYVLTEREIAFAKRIGTRTTGALEIVRYANQKHLALSKAQQLGIPIAPGQFVFYRRNDIESLIAVIDELRSLTGKVFVRAPEGFSGSAQVLVDGKASAFKESLLMLPENTTLVVQVFLPVTVSPNIQLHICQETGSISCATICDQLLDSQLAHSGNIFPSEARTLPQMLNSAYRLAEWLKHEGFAGLVGFDFCEYVDESGASRHFLAEINPRVNASSYAGAVRERTRSGAALSTSLPTTARSFRELTEQLGEHLFDSSTGKGIFPYLTGALPSGKCSFVALGSTRREVEELVARLG